MVPPPAGLRTAAVSSRFLYATGALAVGLLMLGAFWRLVDLKYPATFSFDEHHFVENARNYISRQPDWNDHPPLGKLLLVPAMLLLGDNGLGWRLSSALLGIALVALAGFNATKLFSDRRVGLLTAAFVAADGFFISYSRVALLDTPLTLFIYAALALMLSGTSLLAFAGAAVFVGLAVAVKWTGVCILLVAPWLLWRRNRAPWHLLWMFVVASLVYVAVSAVALHITRQPFSLKGLLGTNVGLLKHHAGFTTWDNSASSKWYSWPFLAHPIVMHHQQVEAGAVRASTSLGNVLFWYAATAALVGTLFAAAAALWRGRRSAAAARAVLTSPELLVIATMIALVLPFMLTHRQSYIFHYLGAYGLALGLLASWLVRTERRRAAAVFAFVVAGAAVSIVYAPVWTNALVSHAGYVARLPFPGWR